MPQNSIVSIVMAAGRGSRMKGYDGNKTLLPLIPEESPCQGSMPILVHILKAIPEGPKAVIVNHRKNDIIRATECLNVTYCEQPQLNGTGGAVLAARSFLENTACENVLITMGDVPLVQPETYHRLVENLADNALVILGFCPEDKKQYGVLELENDRVERITEWKYWRSYPAETRAALSVCNAGIYAVRRDALLQYLSVLEATPQTVVKEINGKCVEIQEFFITDLIEHMVNDGLSIGYVIADDPIETMGVDDMAALSAAQAVFREKYD